MHEFTEVGVIESAVITIDDDSTTILFKTVLI